MKENFKNKPLLLINPRIGQKRMFWPASRLAKLLILCQEKYAFELGIITGTSDYYYLNELIALLEDKPQVIKLAQLEMLGNYLKSCFVYIGIDTGTSRLAAALGVSTIILFGPQKPSKWTLKNDKVQIIYSNASCSPCLPQRQSYCQAKECYLNISVEKIIHKINNIIEVQKFGGGTRIRTGG